MINGEMDLYIVDDLKVTVEFEYYEAVGETVQDPEETAFVIIQYVIVDAANILQCLNDQTITQLKQDVADKVEASL